jgi:hypothetical protein
MARPDAEKTDESYIIGGSRLQVENGETAFGTNGARIYLNGSSELVAEDDAGNTTTIM